MAEERLLGNYEEYCLRIDLSRRGRLTRILFQIFCTHFDCSELVDQLDIEDEAQSVSLSHKNAFDALQRTSFYTNRLAYDEFPIRLNISPLNT